MFAVPLPRFCGGLIKDIKRKAPFFASDFYDALNIQALSAILFIYLATVTNAITFGGLLGDATDNMQVGPVGGGDTNRTAQIPSPSPQCSSVRGRWPFSYSAWFSFFLFLDAAFYFASGLLLYSQHFSSDKNSLMKSGLSHSGEKKGRKWGCTVLFGQKRISCFNFVWGTRWRSSTTWGVWAVLLNLTSALFLGTHDYCHFTQDFLTGGFAYLSVEFSFKEYEIRVPSPIPQSAAH